MTCGFRSFTRRVRLGAAGLILALSASACLVKDAKKVANGEADTGPSVPIRLSFADGAAISLGSVAIGSTRLVYLSVHAQGYGTASVDDSSNTLSSFTFNGGTFPGTGGTCGTTIGGNCSLAVAFTPVLPGLYSNTVTVDYSTEEGSFSTSIAISAQALPPAVLTISDGATYNFGTRVNGSSTDKTFTLTNSGGVTATSLSGAALAAPFAYKGGSYPGTGGNCGSSLVSTGTCTVVVTYSPTAAVTSNSTLQVNYHSGTASTSATRAIQGTGQNPALLTISDSPSYDFGNRVVGSTAVQRTLTVTNSGNTTASAMTGGGLVPPFRFVGGGYPGTGGNCGTTLAAGANCTMVVSFQPSATGGVTDTVELSYSDGAATQMATRPLLGTGIAPGVLTISDGPTYDFGSKAVGTVTEKTLTVNYSGTNAVTAVTGTGLAAPFAFKGGTYPGTGGTCGGTISANCTIVVTFTPASGGLSSDTIVINYNNGASATSAVRDVQGTGQSLATLTISDAAQYDYGTLVAGDTAEHTFTVTYTGQTPATAVNPGVLLAPYSFKGGAFPGTGGSCGTTISANCTIVVKFDPIAAGTFNASLSLDYNDGVSAQNAARAITGAATSPAVITISDSPDYDFGVKALSTTTTKSFTLTNTGGSLATAMSWATLSVPFSFPGGYPGTGGDCGTTLAASATCTVVVEFAPIVAGGYSETLSVTYDDGVTSQSEDRPITGTGGAVANLSISDGPIYAYGTVALAYTGGKLFTVTNVGGSQAASIAETTLAAPFAFNGGAYPGTNGDCGATLLASQSCTLDVVFTPVAASNASSTLTLSYDNGVSTVTSTRDVSGTGATLTAITSGGNHSCVLYSTGEIRCWGADSQGQLGNDAAMASSPSPVKVSGIANATSVVAGANHSCARLSSGRISCWGSDSDGQLGDNAATTDQATPVTVASTTDFVQVAAGGGNLTCGRRSGGTVQCWGDDSQGGNGNGGGSTSNGTPVTVTNLFGAIDLAVGVGHGCGVEGGGDMRCWGWDNHGQLGNSAAMTNQNSSVAVSGVTTAARTWAGGRVSATRLSNGNVEVWGDNTLGQLGIGGGGDEATPVALNAMDDALALAFGADHACGITAANSLECWGSDASGQLGDGGGSADQSSPVAVSGLGTVTAAGAGGSHTCAIASTGLVYCWGDNSTGQLGTGSAGGTSGVPVQVLGL